VRNDNKLRLDRQLPQQLAEAVNIDLIQRHLVCYNIAMR
jgi:hypothetical protein